MEGEGPGARQTAQRRAHPTRTQPALKSPHERHLHQRPQRAALPRGGVPRQVGPRRRLHARARRLRLHVAAPGPACPPVAEARTTATSSSRWRSGRARSTCCGPRPPSGGAPSSPTSASAPPSRTSRRARTSANSCGKGAGAGGEHAGDTGGRQRRRRGPTALVSWRSSRQSSRG